VAGAALAFPTIIPSTVFGKNAPSNRITMGLIGMGRQMGGHQHTMTRRQDVQVLAVCDVARGARERAQEQVERAYGGKSPSGSYKGCAAYNEHERILEREDIDSILICTPDHWHAAMSVAAMKAGKDVYVQKPMTLTVAEGQWMRDIARQYGSILQVGSQQRSNGSFRKACEMVRNGWIGRVHTIYTHFGDFPAPPILAEEAVPEGFDYDRWLGPAPWAPYNRKRVEGDYGGGWRCFWEYGSRKNGDWGAHHFDIIQWALGMDHTGPVEFIPKGWGGAEYQSYIYANGARVWKNHPIKKDHMIHFIGDEGEVLVSREDRLDTTPVELKTRPLAPGEVHLYESYDHEGNWLDCVKTRQAPICPVEIGHRSATICHLSGITERLNRRIVWDPLNERIVDDPEASRWLDRPRRSPYVL
jgi:hypothetical protein